MIIDKGDILVVKNDVITDAGKLLVEKGQFVEVTRVKKSRGYYGKGSGVWHPPKIIGVVIKGFPRSSWNPDLFAKSIVL